MKELTWDEQMFLGDKPGALGLYAAFREALLERFPHAALQVQKTQITFRNPKVFCCVSMARMKGVQGEYIVVPLGWGRDWYLPGSGWRQSPIPAAGPTMFLSGTWRNWMRSFWTG